MRARRKHSSRFKAATCAAALGVVLAGQQAASADTSKGLAGSTAVEISPEQQAMIAQYPMDVAAEQLVHASSGLTPDGYTSIELDTDGAGITLHWNGEVPSGVKAEMDKIQQQGIRVTVAPSKYSLEDLQSKIDAIIAMERSGGLPPEVRATGLAPLPDGTGIEVTVQRQDSKAAEARAALGVVATVLADPPTELIGRQADSAPFWGGSRIKIQQGVDGPVAACTSGFGVARSGSRKFILSAPHCGGVAQGVSNGAGTLIGNVAGNVGAVADGDEMLINVASSGSHIYTGAWNTSTSEQVVSHADTFVNDIVCAGGSFSGARCSIKVTNPDTTEVIGAFTVHHVAQGTSLSGGLAAGQGDSGGPIYSSVSGTTVAGKGLISTGTGTLVECSGDGSVPGRKCFATIRWIPINQALADFSATLNVN